MQFRFSETPLDPEEYKRLLCDPRAGAYASFEGWVRNMNHGKEVRELEYEAHPTLALKVGMEILEAAKQRHEILDAHVVHRVGTVALSEIAVWVGVVAIHRAPALAACAEIMDEIKHRVPIWKKEYYVDGDAQWVRCEHRAAS